MEEVKLGNYRHYKGRSVKVIAVVKHSETLEDLVLYEHADEKEPVLWVRPKEMFLEKVEEDGKLVSRFEYLEE